MCGKTKISSDSVVKNRSNRRTKHLTFRRFSDRNCVQYAIQIKSNKNNFTGIPCADGERYKKTRPKKSLAHRFYLLVIVVNDVSNIRCKLTTQPIEILI